MTVNFKQPARSGHLFHQIVTYNIGRDQPPRTGGILPPNMDTLLLCLAFFHQLQPAVPPAPNTSSQILSLTECYGGLRYQDQLI